MPDRLWSRSEGDGPPVVFLHGWMMDHRDEAATYDAVFAGRGYRRIYLDLPGMGQSAGAAVPDDLDGFADRLTAEIGELTGGEAFLLSGTSAGALLACGIAARQPGGLRGLLLRVPLVHGPDAHRDIDPVRPLRAASPDPDAVPADIAGLLDQPPLIQDRRWTRGLYRKLRERIVPAMRLADLARLGPVRTDPARYDLRHDLAMFDRPALILAARQDDNVGWRDALSRFADWRRATLALLDAAGHEFPLDRQMPLMRALVEDWLDRLEVAP